METLNSTILARSGFSAPAYPWDTIVIDLSRDSDVVSFEASGADCSKAITENGELVSR